MSMGRFLAKLCHTTRYVLKLAYVLYGCLYKISNEEVLQRGNEAQTMLDAVGKCKRVVRACAKIWIITAWYNREKNEGELGEGRKRMLLLSYLMNGKYVALKRTAEDRKEWQSWKSYTCFSADYLNEWCSYMPSKQFERRKTPIFVDLRTQSQHWAPLCHSLMWGNCKI